MRICLLSEYSGKIDEGMRNTASYLENGLSKSHDVIHLCVLPASNLLSPDFWKKLTRLNPQIINYIPGPSLKALFFLKILKPRFPGSKTVVMATHPFFSRFSRKLIPLVKPDLVLTPYKVKDPIFPAAGCRTAFLPNGIDLERFSPATPDEKKRLRQQYGLDVNKFIALHVGSMDKDRNVILLKELQQNGTQVVIVGSTSLPEEPEVSSALADAGCIVWRKYFPNVADIHRLADCYVFPTLHWRKCMELPVSVMEAMACNLPVVATRYKALPQMFEPGDGLFFADTEAQFVDLFKSVSQNPPAAKTRRKVEPYAWAGILSQLEGIYKELYGARNAK